MKNLLLEIASSLSHFGWSPVAHKTGNKRSGIKFDVNDFYDFATLDLYVGDSTWSREHMFSLSCIIECLKNVHHQPCMLFLHSLPKRPYVIERCYECHISRGR